MAIFRSACYDCHSNETRYPWYSHIAPVSWWMKHHINEAREQGVDSVAVTWGYNNYDVLLSGNPWRIVRLPDEIPNAVTEYFRGKH
jgi:hypothetical protein